MISQLQNGFETAELSKEQGCAQAVGQRKLCKTNMTGCGNLEKYVSKTFASAVHIFQILSQ